MSANWKSEAKDSLNKIEVSDEPLFTCMYLLQGITYFSPHYSLISRSGLKLFLYFIIKISFTGERSHYLLEVVLKSLLENSIILRSLLLWFSHPSPGIPSTSVTSTLHARAWISIRPGKASLQISMLSYTCVYETS